MHHDRKRINEAQARLAERLDVEPDPVDPAVRYVVLDGRRLGRLEFDGDATWSLFYWIEGEWRDSLDSVEGDVDDEDRDAALHGIGFVADAIARGELSVDKEA